MRQVIELQITENKSIFVEAHTDEPSSVRPLAAGQVDRITKKFDEISEIIGLVATNIEEQIGKLAKAPKRVEVEIHAVIKAGGKLFIAEGSAEGGVKLKLSWER